MGKKYLKKIVMVGEHKYLNCRLNKVEIIVERGVKQHKINRNIII